MKYKGKISYNVKRTHPDIAYIKNPEERMTFEDTYKFSSEYSKEDAIPYIKHDLTIVANGGYTTDKLYIENVKFTINGEEV